MSEGICGRHGRLNCPTCHVINVRNDSREHRIGALAENRLDWEEWQHTQRLRTAQMLSQTQGFNGQPQVQQPPQNSATQLGAHHIPHYPVSPIAGPYQPQQQSNFIPDNSMQQQQELQLLQQRHADERSRAAQQLFQTQLEHQTQLNQKEAEAQQIRTQRESEAAQSRRHAEEAITAAIAAEELRTAREASRARQEMIDKADGKRRELENEAREIEEAQALEEERILDTKRKMARLKEEACLEDARAKAQEQTIQQQKILADSKLRAAGILAQQELQARKDALEADRIKDIEDLERKKREHDNWVARERQQEQNERQEDHRRLLRQRNEEDRRREAESQREFERRQEVNEARRIQEDFELRREENRRRQLRKEEDTRRSEDLDRRKAKRNTAAAQRRAILDADSDAQLLEIRNQKNSLEAAQFVQKRQFEDALREQEENNLEQQKKLALKAIADRRARTSSNVAGRKGTKFISDVSRETNLERIRAEARQKNALRLKAEEERDGRLLEERASNTRRIENGARYQRRTATPTLSSALTTKNEENRKEQERKEQLLKRLQALKPPAPVPSPNDRPQKSQTNTPAPEVSEEERARLELVEKLRRTVINNKSPPGSPQMGFSSARPKSTVPAPQATGSTKCKHSTNRRLCDICN